MNDKKLKEWLLSRYNEDESHFDQDERKYSVYIHIVPKALSGYDYDKYYVGITSKKYVKTRWGQNGKGYKYQYFNKAIQKYGWDNIEHEIIAQNLTEDEAKELEISLIASLKSNNPKYGYNASPGGEPENRSPVVLLNTNEVFLSLVDAANKYNVDANNISGACRNTILSAGKDKKGNPLVWVYYEDYLNMSELERNNKLHNTVFYYNHQRAPEPFVCLNTGEIFYYMYDAQKKYNLSEPNFIKCFTGERKFHGTDKHFIKLLWLRYSDYIKLSPQEIIDRIDEVNSIGCKPIIDLETNTVYKTIKTCSRYIELSNGLINQAVLNKYPKYQNRFIYYYDYLKQNNLDINKTQKGLIFIE